MQLISPLLALITFFVIAVLVLLAMIQQRSSTTRRVVLQRAAVPFYRDSGSNARSITLPRSLAARAPPTFSPDPIDTDRAKS